MAEVVAKTLTFPAGLDEAGVEAMLQEILDGIDRDKFFEDPSLIRVRHPLLQERMGRDLAIDVEIFNLITGIVDALSLSDTISNRDDLIADIPYLEAILLRAAKDPAQLQATLVALKDAAIAIAAVNPADNLGPVGTHLVHEKLRGKLQMPSAVQELILYPAVTADSLGETAAEILDLVERCRATLVEALDGQEIGVTVVPAAESEAAAIRTWFESRAA